MYKEGQTITIMYDQTPAEVRITNIDTISDMVCIEVITIGGEPAENWTERLPIEEVMQREEDTKYWRKNVDTIKTKLDTPEKLLKEALERMDWNYNDYDYMRQAYIEQVRSFFGIDLSKPKGE